MDPLRGIPASPGIALGPSFVIRQPSLRVDRDTVKDPKAELDRLESALELGRQQLNELVTQTQEEIASSEAAIFDAHAMFLDDPALLDRVRQAIQTDRLNAPAAWKDSIEHFAQQMEAVDDEYLRARASDIRDVGRRVLRILLGKEDSEAARLSTPSIIIARDLAPSDTVQLNRELVLGFGTAEGGATSHTAILAKALGLPAVVGVGPKLTQIGPGVDLILDGNEGSVWVAPDREMQDEFRARQAKAHVVSVENQKHAHAPAVSRDGVQVEIVANIGSLDDSHTALDMGAEGVGLLRTEFLYLDRQSAPTEQEQTEAYGAILEVMGDRPVVVRTLDVGGDKPLPYLQVEEEQNAFLGWRAIRMCLDKPDFFKIQLRALWRSSLGHDLRIMFPMIATVDEVRQARALLDEARNEVLDAGHAISDSVQVGIMVEIPSVAILSDLMAPEVDFFSVGTNDLTQYTLAADRTNQRVARLGDACHPAVLRQIRDVTQAAHDHGKWVGVCGELAGDPAGIPILLGLGLDELSMTPHAIPAAKAQIRRWSAEDAKRLANDALSLASAESVRQLVSANQA
ncbi:MAG: phosphoenolpyruvate--protein phosphotransferase [Anaerolineales bacterium]